jgi:urea carboxylase-associated protein 2
MDGPPTPDAATATLESARVHARSQVGSVEAATGRTIPTGTVTDLPDGVAPGDVVWDETLGAGGYAGHLMPRGARLRVADVEGDASVHLVVHNARCPSERVNVADTVKVQWQAYLGAGALVLSDLGRVLMTVVADTSARHDALCGCSTRVANERRYGSGGVHGTSPNARDLLALAGARYDLARRDIPTGITLFKGVRVGLDGALSFDGAPTAPTFVELRAEMDLIVTVVDVPHPLDPRGDYVAGPVRLTAWRAERPDPDPYRDTSPERSRAFDNTEEALAAVVSVTENVAP